MFIGSTVSADHVAIQKYCSSSGAPLCEIRLKPSGGILDNDVPLSKLHGKSTDRRRNTLQPLYLIMTQPTNADEPDPDDVDLPVRRPDLANHQQASLRLQE
jgi:hypothetical protein